MKKRIIIDIYFILQPQWEVRQLADGRVYFIDHRKMRINKAKLSY